MEFHQTYVKQGVTPPPVAEFSTLTYVARKYSPEMVTITGVAKQVRVAGMAARALVSVRADTAAERLWAAEQLIKAQACGALVAWLPQARAEQIRRLQVLAAGFDAPVFVCRPTRALRESSAAPLRVQAAVGLDWALQVRIAKRKGPPLDDALHLASVPGALAAVLPPRLGQPSRWFYREAIDHAVVRPSAQPERRHSAVH